MSPVQQTEPEDLEIGISYYVLPKASGTDEQWEIEMVIARYAGRNGNGALLWRFGKEETEKPIEFEMAWIGPAVDRR